MPFWTPESAACNAPSDHSVFAATELSVFESVRKSTPNNERTTRVKRATSITDPFSPLFDCDAFVPCIISPILIRSGWDISVEIPKPHIRGQTVALRTTSRNILLDGQRDDDPAHGRSLADIRKRGNAAGSLCIE